MNPVISVSFYLSVQLLTMLAVSDGIRTLLPPGLGRKLALAAILTAYAACMALPVAGTFLPAGRLKFAVQGAGDIWLGFYIFFMESLFVFYVPWAIIRLITKKPAGRSSGIILLLAAAAGFVILICGMAHAQNTRVTRYELTTDKPLKGGQVKIALIADLHLSVNSHPETIRRMVEMVNEEQADVVLVGGDIFTSSYKALDNPGAYAEALAGMEARDGVYAVYGNHDVEEELFGGFPITPISKAFRGREMEQFMADSGFTVLEDETVEIADGTVLLTGRIDGQKAGDGTKKRMGAGKLLAGTDPGKLRIVLEHEPVQYAALKEAGADLVLSGHTHAGQIFPGNLVVPFYNENAYGYRRIGGLDTVVTSGIGYYGPPMRVGTDSEVTVVTVTGPPA